MDGVRLNLQQKEKGLGVSQRCLVLITDEKICILYLSMTVSCVNLCAIMKPFHFGFLFLLWEEEGRGKFCAENISFN